MAARGGKQGACQHISGCDVSTQFNEISPLNMKDLELAQEIKMKNKENQPVTPHRSSKGPMKRKLCELQNEPNEVDNGNGGPIPKKPLMALNTLQSLTDEQLKIINIIKEGQSVFITGSAGTGKSYLLKRIIKMLPPDTTYCTASTGAAACIINGTTLHSFAGIGTGNSSLDQCISLASKEHKAYHWKKCKILLIDEVSMIDGNYFDKIEAVARGVRKSKAPFGGIQLILCGDFLQLPPVCKDSKDKCFCFQAKSWRKCINHTVELTKVYRQNDMKFVAILQNIRIGRCPDSIVNLLQNTESQSIERNGIRATKLYTHSADVDSTNEREMNALVGESKTFKAIDDQPNHTEQINTLCPVPSSLELKIGAQVSI
jgi:ATP-dependent DNA helicase PIF1